VSNRKVLVVGGGIAGLTLTIALRRRGIDVDVVELQPQWNILGVGISLLTEYVGWLGVSLQLPVALAVLLIVILVRPAGLFGHVVVRRV